MKYQQDRADGDVMYKTMEWKAGMVGPLFASLLCSVRLGDGSCCCFVGTVWSFGMLLFSHENNLSSSLFSGSLLPPGARRAAARTWTDGEQQGRAESAESANTASKARLGDDRSAHVDLHVD